jgi:hypothetical protein
MAGSQTLKLTCAFKTTKPSICLRKFKKNINKKNRTQRTSWPSWSTLLSGSLFGEAQQFFFFSKKKKKKNRTSPATAGALALSGGSTKKIKK